MTKMTSTFRILASILLAGSLTAVGVSAQSLAAVARQTKAREKSIKTHSKVYTNADLSNAGDDAAPAPASQNGATSADAGTATDAASKPAADSANKKADAKPSSDSTRDAKAPVKDRAYWHKRITDARAMRDQTQLLLDAMQSRINALTADFAARDDPAQRAQIAQDRTKALSELETLKKTLKSANDRIDNIQEEARREGVPPGWLR